MLTLSYVTGAILVLTGVVGYVGTGQASVTALIPAFIGAVYLIGGFLARNANLRKHVMHALAAVSLLAMLATVGRAVGVFTLLSGGTLERPAAAISSALTFVMCLIFLAMAVRSFIEARKARALA